jgi:hypothetical protein
MARPTEDMEALGAQLARDVELQRAPGTGDVRRIE